MPRTTIQVSFQDAQAHVHEAVKKILLEAGYHEVAYGDEIVWKKGTGMLTAMQYIKVTYQGNTLFLSGWTRVGLGQYGFKEQDLEGFVAAIPKKMVKKVMGRIQSAVAHM